jgi:response regulator RpfG family c-di-GMP phosphodiesterase
MEKILIVDDNSQNLYMLEILLKTNGFAVDKASNGLEALELAKNEQPDLVISDILMPGMDGFSLCRTWNLDKHLKNIPFVFYTATYIDPRDEKLALDIGAKRFIAKPLDPDVFIAAIRSILKDYQAGISSAPREPIENEEVFYKEYNEALIRKLEEKMEQLQRSNRRLSSLYQASFDLLTLQSSAELIRIILNVIVEKAGYQQANFFSFDESAGLLYLDALEGYSEDSFAKLRQKLIFALGEPKGIVGLAAQTRKPINLTDTTKDPNWIALDPVVKSALFTPVIFEKRLLGVIGLFSKELNAFTDDDVHDVSVLANNLAIAIENNRNQEKAQKQLARISALHNIDTAINSSMDLHNMLDIFLKQVTNQLKMDAADIILLKPNESICEFAAGRGFETYETGNHPIHVERNLAKNAILDKRAVHLTSIEGQSVSAEYANMWKKEGFVAYAGIPLIAKGEVLGALEVYNRKYFEPDEDWLDFFTTLAGQAAIAVDKGQIFAGLQRSNLELSMAYDATIKGWSGAMDMRDHETEGHTQRVTEMTIRLAEIMGFSGEDIVQLRRGALLHDIGKLSVPDSILLKPGELTEEEAVIMRKHPQSAHDLLQPITYLQPALDIPYCHHEKWDGSGYPLGLKGENIPLAARIFTVIDVYDALRTDRPYRKAWSETEVVKFIREQSGISFDPKIVDKFLKLIDQEKRQ